MEEKTITHYDLFAGIGGFSLALERVYGEEYKINHIFSEWEAFPTAVLKQHWPNGKYYGDIKDLIADTTRQGLQGQDNVANEQQTGRSGISGRTAIVTGGFPCQPFSHAGKRRGTADDRYQWPNMLQVIRNVTPDWVIAENVRGLTTWNDGMVLETVCADLEAEGYEVQPFIIPAAGVGAPHRRERIWILGRRIATDTNNQRNTTRPAEIQRPYEQVSERHNNAKPSNPNWSLDWRHVAITTCNAGMDDGIPRRMDGATISAAKWRELSIKAYGNAIVPQVAEQIFKAIKQSEEGAIK
jgi:DNA (cytosine-5)-methyltransferase 1